MVKLSLKLAMPWELFEGIYVNVSRNEKGEVTSVSYSSTDVVSRDFIKQFTEIDWTKYPKLKLMLLERGNEPLCKHVPPCVEHLIIVKNKLEFIENIPETVKHLNFYDVDFKYYGDKIFDNLPMCLVSLEIIFNLDMHDREIMHEKVKSISFHSLPPTIREIRIDFEGITHEDKKIFDEIESDMRAAPTKYFTFGPNIELVSFRCRNIFRSKKKFFLRQERIKRKKELGLLRSKRKREFSDEISDESNEKEARTEESAGASAGASVGASVEIDDGEGDVYEKYLEDCKKTIDEGNIRGHMFEKHVEQKLRDAGYRIYGTNMRFKINGSQSEEIDILLYKTIIECKSIPFSNINSSRFTFGKMVKQIEKMSHIHNGFTIVLWLSNITEEDRETFLYRNFKRKFPKLIITDSVEDFMKQYTVPEEFYYISKGHTVWNIIAKNRKDTCDDIMCKIKIPEKIMKNFECFIDDPEERKNFDELKKKAIIIDNDCKKATHTIDKYDIEISGMRFATERKYDFTFDGFKFRLSIPQTKSTSIGHPMWVIDGFIKCSKCDKPWTERLVKDGICFICEKKS